ncbi:MAG: ABC transporter substrate-binding protein, partial [Pseudomonadota bacterium]
MHFRSLAAAAALFVSSAVAAETSMPFALDWKFEGPSAPYFVAIDNGYFAEADLAVEISPGKGSLDAIPKVATGAFPVGMADINSLVRFLDQNPGAPVTAVMMIYDKPPFAVVGRKSLGVEAPKNRKLRPRTIGWRCTQHLAFQIFRCFNPQRLAPYHGKRWLV